VRRISPIALAISLLLLSSFLVHGQEHPLLRDHPGGWNVKDQRLSQEFTAAERAAAAAFVTQVADILRGAPSLTTPRGFDVLQHSALELDVPGNGSARPKMISGLLTFNLAPYESGPGGPLPNERDTAVSIKIAVNELSMVTGGEITQGNVTFGDEQGDFLKDAPDPAETKHDAPVYEQGDDRFVILRGHDVPILAPVSRERYLAYRLRAVKTQIDHAEASLAKLNQNDPMLAGPLATMREQLSVMHALQQKMQHDLDTMSTDDRQTPAVVTLDAATEPPEFGDGGSAIVYLNPALFDPKRPRTAPQVLAVSIVGDEDRWPGLAAKIDQELDWAALLKLVRQ
jgi:hypothetical protein